MRIGVVTTSYPRDAGDPAGSFVAAHVGWLRSAGHQVEVVAAGAGDGRVAARTGLFDAGGAPEALATVGRPWLAAGSFAARLTARVAWRARRWDAVVAHWLVPCAVSAALATRLPVLAVAHSGDVHLVSRLGLAGAVAGALDRERIRLVFVSEALRARFLAGLPAGRRQRLGARSLVQPMGVDTRRLAAARPERRGGRPRVVFVGRLVPVKGVDLLLDAVAQLPVPTELVVAGDGPERSALQRRARRLGIAADFRGALEPGARDRLLASADVVALPSRPVEGGRVEGAPLVAREALAVGAPVVAAASGGLAELPADAAVLVPPEDAAALAAALTRLLADPARMEALSRAGRRYAADHDWQRVGPRLWEWGRLDG